MVLVASCALSSLFFWHPPVTQTFMMTWQPLFYYLQMVILVAIFLGAVAIIQKINDQPWFPPKLQWPLIIVIILFLHLSVFNGLARWYFSPYSGEVGRVFVVHNKTVTVLLSRIENSGLIRTYHTSRLMTFDLETGQPKGSLMIVKHNYDSSLKIYPPFEGKAWPTSPGTKLELIDLEQPAMIANYQDILKHNPVLGEFFTLIYSDYLITNHGLQIKGSNGSFFRLNPDLSLTPLKGLHDYHPIDVPMGPVTDYISLNYKTGLNWPKQVPELNKKSSFEWIVHYSKAPKREDEITYLSYIDAQGKELKRFNLTQELDNKFPQAIAVYTHDNFAYVIVSKWGATLSALKIDKANMTITTKINYINQLLFA